LTFNGLHGVICQKIKLSITAAVRTSNPTYSGIVPEPQLRRRVEKHSFINKYFELTIILERYQSKVLRMIADAPWYGPKDVIRNDLGMTTVKEEIKQLSVKYCDRLNKHPNALAIDLMSQPIRNRRLKRFAPNDLPGRF
jgi:hypothetical protein